MSNQTPPPQMPAAPAGPTPTPTSAGQLAAAVAAMQQSIATSDAAKATATAAPAAEAPSAQPVAPVTSPSATDPSRPSPPPAGDDRYTQLYASNMELDRQLQTARAQVRQLQGQSTDPAMLQALPVKDKLSRVGLSFEEVFDAWTESLSSGQSSATSTQPTGTAAAPTTDPALQQISQQLQAMQSKLDAMDAEKQQQAQQQAQQQQLAGAATYLLGEAEKTAERYRYFIARQKAGLRDQHGRTPAELAVLVGNEIMKRAGGLAPTSEVVLATVEEHLQQQAQSWQLSQPAAPQAQVTAAAAQPSIQRPAALPPATPSPGGDTPQPRDLTPQERIKAAVAAMQKSVEARTKGATQ